MKKTNAPEGAAQNNSTLAQRTRLLAELIDRDALGVTTIYAREQLDVMSPAPRIMELRKRGFEILTIWTTEETAQGNQHRIARYVLTSTNGMSMEAC
ncbi:hypothetical protein A3762_06665 [Oleiphilus sp. HI0125]|uniref:helix-turn-helix domain-containing protein n=1 Tax=Oleiphilus sp. HI0125 TaxID=1822266 RepID=UPI0007C206EB|nr:helix-turn-helix domain-containing protein [Oleiphilus sp. HI0125]KZZ58850.1 hypothetical protein A3762_06665 [Oleiphilus sp. HI0125]